MVGRTGLRRADRSGAVADFAAFHAGDLYFLDAAAHCVPEIYIEFIFERTAGLRFFFNACAGAAAKKIAEEVAETGSATGCSAAAAEIESAEIKIDVVVGTSCSGSVVTSRNIFAVEAILIVHLALLRVGENVVGFLKLLEFFLGGFVAGIQIGMVFACEFAESGANIFRRSLAADSEEFVVVGFCCGRHFLKGGENSEMCTMAGRGHSAHFVRT